MKINTRIVWAFDDHLGEQGWKVKRLSNFNISSLQGLVHDILEHAPRDKGTFREEIAAYGSIVAWRLDQSDLLYPGNHVQRKAQLLGKELGEFLGERFDCKDLTELKGLHIFPRKQKLADCAFLYDVANATLSKLLDESLYWDLDLNYVRNNQQKIFDWILAWLNHGYLRSMKQLNTTNHYPADIWDNVYTMLKQNIPEEYNYEIDAEISIQIDLDCCRCDVIPIRFIKQFK